ncbi:uncharacterized protein SOCE26_034450 [Sorangium cellulosum]|uniref:Uncharacterized protein n=1 Tax=Sorangium cellulosum TaxID=56 RepID=A0A2L0ERY0_SORCE|nr:uncharacterized protein SOCE26_034450 [Sorangium cellulosum]
MAAYYAAPPNAPPRHSLPPKFLRGLEELEENSVRNFLNILPELGAAPSMVIFVREATVDLQAGL